MVNDRRKATGLDLADRIELRLYADARIADAARRHQPWIAEEVLAVSFTVHEPDGVHQPDATVEGEPVAIALTRV